MSEAPDRVASLEKSIRNAHRALFALGTIAVLLPLVLSVLVMRWVEAAHEGTSYLVTDEEGVIYGMTRVAGQDEARVVTLSLATYPSGGATGKFGEVEAVATQLGSAELQVRAGTGNAPSISIATIDGSPRIVFRPSGKGGARHLIVADEEGLLARTIDADNKVVREERLWPAPGALPLVAPPVEPTTTPAKAE